MKGKFITFEGFEGSGKTTHIKLLAEFLMRLKYPVVILREPGSTKIGQKLRNILLDKKNASILDKTELLLYLAARAQIVEEKIMPELKKGKIVLCDRFHDATLAYQGYGLGMDKTIIGLLGKFVTSGIAPDLTILLDISVEDGLRRAGKNRDRIEQRSYGYHQRVRNGYLEIADREPKRVKLIQIGGSSIAQTQGKIRAIVKEFLIPLGQNSTPPTAEWMNGGWGRRPTAKGE